VSRRDDAQDILRQLGLPAKQQNEVSALTLLALAGIRESDKWSRAQRQSLTVRKGIMEFVNTHYKQRKPYAENTREVFRRQVLHQLVQARIVDLNPDNPLLATNSSKTHYALTDDVVRVLRKYGTRRWPSALRDFRAANPPLTEVYSRRRTHKLVPLRLPEGTRLRLSPGKHSQLLAAIVEGFGPRFAPGAQVLYLGDTANKTLVINPHELARLGVTVSEHGKLPDVMLHDPLRRWLFLIEAVTSHGPMSPKRVAELESLVPQRGTGLVFLTAFPDFGTFKRYVHDIAWDTEVWIAELPDHLIHYNGDRFLGPR